MDIPDNTNNHHEPFIEQDVVIKTTNNRESYRMLATVAYL